MKTKPAIVIDLNLIFNVKDYIMYDLNARHFINWAEFGKIYSYAPKNSVICLVYANKNNIGTTLLDTVMSKVSEVLLSSTGKPEMFYSFTISNEFVFPEYKVLSDVFNIACESGVIVDVSNSVMFAKGDYYTAAKAININSVFKVLDYEDVVKTFQTGVVVDAPDDVGGNI